MDVLDASRCHDPLDEELRKDGIEMIAPHRSNRSKPPTQPCYYEDHFPAPPQSTSALQGK